MRFLKNKILKALEVKKLSQETHVHSCTEEEITAISTAVNSPQPSQDPASSLSSPLCEDQPKKRCRKNDGSKPRRAPSSTKNITANFGKAIASFVSSHLALPYLEPILEQKRISYIDFFNFVDNSKDRIRSIDTFKSLLLVEETDTNKQKAFKATFKALAEIFIKYFSVNWITHGKVTHKLVYLKYRHKMLRRIQNPENFTYVKKRSSKKNKSDK